MADKNRKKEMTEAAEKEPVQKKTTEEAVTEAAGNEAIVQVPASEIIPAKDEAAEAENLQPVEEGKNFLISFSEHAKLLPGLITKPATCGSEFIRKHPADASVFAMLLQGLATGFFFLSLCHSLNVMLLQLLLNLGSTVNQGLSSLSSMLQGVAESIIKSLLSYIPEVGERLGSSLSGAAGSGIDYVAGLFSMKVTDFLSKLFLAMQLSEGGGFAIGFFTTLVQSLLLVLLLKLFLRFAKHPCRSFQESLAAMAVRSMIAVPVILVSSIIAMFNPLLGILAFATLFIFELVYLYSALSSCVDGEQRNRLGVLFAFYAVLMMIISLAALGFILTITGLDIFARVSAMIYEIAM